MRALRYGLLTLALALVPATALGATAHTKAKINANPAVTQLSKLHDRAEALIGNNPNDEQIVNMTGDIVTWTYDDYAVIARAEGVKPFISDRSEFIHHEIKTAKRKIKVDGLIGKMTKQHCSLVKRFPSLPLSSGFAPIIRWLYTARNKALKQMGLPTIPVPSKAALCK